MMNDWKDRLGVVYSTAADFDYRTAESEEAETLAPAAQQLCVRIEKKGRGGKTATLVSGFVGTSADLADLGRTLKSKCGVGGSVKDGEILVQGDFRERVVSLLRSLGYTGTK
jgi:putative translation initiation factor SUI1